MAFSGLLVACGGTSKIASLPLETLEGKNIPSISEKPNKDDLKTWPQMYSFFLKRSLKS